MIDLNRVFLLGRLGQDPVAKESRNGQPYTVLRVATQRRGPAQSTENSPAAEPQSTDWHTVTVWGSQGAACSQHLKKGQCVLVEGAVSQFKKEGPEGEARYFQQINARTVHFLSRPRAVTEHEPPH